MKRKFDFYYCYAMAWICGYVGAVAGGLLAIGFGLMFFTVTKAVGGGLVGIVVGFFVAGLSSYIITARTKE